MGGLRSGGAEGKGVLWVGGSWMRRDGRCGMGFLLTGQGCRGADRMGKRCEMRRAGGEVTRYAERANGVFGGRTGNGDERRWQVASVGGEIWRESEKCGMRGWWGGGHGVAGNTAGVCVGHEAALALPGSSAEVMLLVKLADIPEGDSRLETKTIRGGCSITFTFSFATYSCFSTLPDRRGHRRYRTECPTIPIMIITPVLNYRHIQAIYRSLRGNLIKPDSYDRRIIGTLVRWATVDVAVGGPAAASKQA